MSKFTFVVEFNDGEEPAVNGETEVLGGRLIAVGFMDYRDDHLTEEEQEAVEQIMADDHDKTDSWCAELGVSAEEIIKKLRLLVY